MKLGERLLMAWGWAALTGGLGFLLLLTAPLMIGGPGAHQAPLLAFMQLPISFGLSLLVVAILPKAGALLLAAMLTAGSLYCFNLYQHQQQVMQEYRADFALQHAEQPLLQVPPFALSVAVQAGDQPAVYQQHLISELRNHRWFSRVAALGEIERPDLVATVTGSYYGDRSGQSFRLAWHDLPAFSQPVKAWRWLGDTSGLYEQRLTVELVQAVQTLQYKRRAWLQAQPRERSDWSASRAGG